MNEAITRKFLDRGPYRIVPGSKLVSIASDVWSIEGPGTRRQDNFTPLERARFETGALPPIFEPLEPHPERWWGQPLPEGSCSDRVLQALLREQAVVRASRDTPATEAELEALVQAGACGVLIIAMHKPNYGRLAAALAATIKRTSPGLPVALAWSGHALDELADPGSLFDHLIPIDAVLSSDANRHAPFYVKLCVDRLTPFQRTLFIDADSLIYSSADLRREFLRYRGHDFVPTTSMVWYPDELPPDATYMCWGTLHDLVDHFGLKEPIIQAHSYYFYFESSEPAREVLRCARHAYTTLSSRAGQFVKYLNADRVLPDELALGIGTSMAGLGVYFEQHQPMVESGLFHVKPPSGLESCYVGFTVTGYNPNWIEHYQKTLVSHGLGDCGYELQKELPAWLVELQREAIAT